MGRARRKVPQGLEATHRPKVASHTVLVALAERGRRPLPFTRAAVFYPDCRALEPLKTTVPVLMLLGAEDDMTPSGFVRTSPDGLRHPGW